ncbi:MAG: WXG100 family type VII secretion target [Oscillospiraceae bacterium]|nr:WXG100 family type VII secretion target [Oscillospiraceae bacterium]
MPDISNIDSEKIKAAAKQMDEIIGRVSGCVGKFKDAVANLDKGWVSDVKAGFMDNFRKDSDAMEEMIAQLREVAAGLIESATEFEKTESEIKAGVSSLR